MAPNFLNMRFLAFDSFEGLPKPQGIDISLGYSSHFHESQFSCSVEAFKENLAAKGVDLDKVGIIKGWFDKTLLPEKAIAHGVKDSSCLDRL